MRGVRVVTNVERNAVDANVPIDERHDLRTAKSCGPGAPMQAPSRPRCLEHRADDGGNKLVHRGEYEVSRKPLRREGRCDSALPVVTPVCAFRAIFAHGAAGAAGTRSSLRPLIFRRVKADAKLGRKSRREDERTCSASVIAVHVH